MTIRTRSLNCDGVDTRCSLPSQDAGAGVSVIDPRGAEYIWPKMDNDRAPLTLRYMKIDLSVGDIATRIAL